MFFLICDFLKISPKDFFEYLCDDTRSKAIVEITQILRLLKDDQINALHTIITRLK
ncbi:hypothetical protein SAMN02910398_03699 [Butyrivibrio sp. YAB3001]|nr:hypothetical protein SAMN02910398_03699 [Butyrivibrio sp. YAB3001]